MPNHPTTVADTVIINVTGTQHKRDLSTNTIQSSSSSCQNVPHPSTLCQNELDLSFASTCNSVETSSVISVSSTFSRRSQRKRKTKNQDDLGYISPNSKQRWKKNRSCLKKSLLCTFVAVVGMCTKSLIH